MSSGFMDNLIALVNPKYKKVGDYVEDILNEYKVRHPVYEEFRLVSHKAIEALLEEGGYKYQISSRTKTPERLQEKIIRKKDQGTFYSSINDIEDLVGLRIIFYTERDKERFINRIKSEIDGFMKIEELEKINGYKSTHIVMSFGPKRLKLSEYKHFNGLKSEIQITSILHHAWAEIEHDLIYKDIHNLKANNPKRYELIKEKMSQLMEKYIKKAAKELEEVIEQDVR